MTELEDRLRLALADRYPIERELGQGGMATVYLAQDLRHRRRVAVKVLRPDLAAALGSDRFLREIEVAAQLQHPHILPLLDSGEVGGFLYYVMPFVDGESLRERLARQGELPVSEAVRIVSEVVDALAAAHAAGVVHRDIKPDNVMLSGRHALVMDFGVAKAVSEATGRSQLTTAGVALGTPSYMAPEQAAADPLLDHRVDIYAVGVLAYELLTGRAPFNGATAQQVLAAHMTQAPEPVERYRPGISGALSEVVMKCLAKRPADRWQSAEELLAQLESLSTAHQPPREFPRWAAWVAGGALVAAGALALSLRQAPARGMVLGRRTAVAASAELELWPTLLPDGRSVLYTRSDDTSSSIVIQQVTGGAPMVVSAGVPGFNCCQAVSPDGSRILFAATGGLHVMPTLGGQARKLADGRVAQASWAPDGERVVYTPSFDTLVVLPLEGSGRRVLVAGTELHSPAWSHDGEWIAYVDGNVTFHRDGNSASSAIKLVRAEGGEPVDVTGSGSLNTSPVWIPGRRAILFVSDRDGGRDIYEQALSRSGAPAGPPVRITTGLDAERVSISADGRRIAWSVLTLVSNVWSFAPRAGDSVPFSAATAVTSGSQNIESAVVSSDGAWLYYDSDRGGNFDIWRIPLAGGAPEQITTDPQGDFTPAISPDGRELAFHSLRSGGTNRDIFVMPAAGGPAVPVTTNPGDDRAATWSADGRALAWMDGFSSDSGIVAARRNPDGTWAPARRYRAPFLAALPTWTPDGAIAFSSESGMHRLDPATGAVTQLLARRDLLYYAWSGDRRTIYAVDFAPQGARIVALTPPDTIARTVAYSDNPRAQGYRYSISAGGGRLYVPLSELQVDVWVAEVEGR